VNKTNAFAFLAGLLVACTGGAVASGPTQAAFDQLVAQVATVQASLGTVQTNLAAAEASITTLETNLATLQGAALGAQVFASTAGGTFKASMAPEVSGQQVLGTFVGADAGKLSLAASIKLSSPAGYYYELPTDPGPIGAAPMFLGETLFDGPGCTGNAWLREDVALTPYGARQGVVTRHEGSNAGPYWMVVKGTVREQVNFASKRTPSSCIDGAGSLVGYALVQNDPLETGVENAPIGADVKLGPDE
jgi:hypothetical protein